MGLSSQARGQAVRLIGGNHDSPRTSDSGNLLKLFAGIPGMRIETGLANAFRDRRLDLEVLCIPSNSLLQGERIDYVPSFGRKHSLLTLHGMASQALPENHHFDVEETRSDRWTYVALGDYHIHQAYGRNVCYAGSTDYTSTNIWEEARTQRAGSGSTPTRQARAGARSTRIVLDLPVINAYRPPPRTDCREDESGRGCGKTTSCRSCRQRISNVLPEVRPKIPMDALREISARCVNYRFVPWCRTPRPTA